MAPNVLSLFPFQTLSVLNDECFRFETCEGRSDLPPEDQGIVLVDTDVTFQPVFLDGTFCCLQFFWLVPCRT